MVSRLRKGGLVFNKLALAIGILLISAPAMGCYDALDSILPIDDYEAEKVSFLVNVTFEGEPVRALVGIRNDAYTVCNKIDDEKGVASFKNVPPGEYELIVIPYLFEDLSAGFVDEKDCIASVTGMNGTRMDIVVTEKLEGETIDVALGPITEDSEISSKVKIDTGSSEHEILGLLLMISAFNESSLYLNTSLYVNTTAEILSSIPESGIDFKMNVPEGDYIVAVTAFAFLNATGGPSVTTGWRGVEARSGDEQEISLTLKDLEDTNFDLNLTFYEDWSAQMDFRSEAFFNILDMPLFLSSIPALNSDGYLSQIELELFSRVIGSGEGEIMSSSEFFLVDDKALELDGTELWKEGDWLYTGVSFYFDGIGERNKAEIELNLPVMGIIPVSCMITLPEGYRLDDWSSTDEVKVTSSGNEIEIDTSDALGDNGSITVILKVNGGLPQWTPYIIIAVIIAVVAIAVMILAMIGKMPRKKR